MDFVSYIFLEITAHIPLLSNTHGRPFNHLFGICFSLIAHLVKGGVWCVTVIV